MRTYDEEIHEKKSDFPHELIMDLKGLEYQDVSTGIQYEIDEFARIFDRVFEDGFIDEKEEQELYTKSYSIAKAIEAEHGPASDGDGTLGAVVGLLVGIGAVLGINQLFKS